MSCYQRSQAEYKLPSSQVAKNRRSIAEAAIARQEKIFVELERFADDVKRGMFPKSELKKAMSDEMYGHSFFSHGKTLLQKRLTSIKETINGMYSYDHEVAITNNALAGKKPKKKDIMTGKVSDTEFTSGDLTVEFRKNTMFWFVSENNHAHDDAVASWLGKKFLQSLKKVEWTRGSGGVMYYSDEYMMDDGFDNGSSVRSLINIAGPLGDKILKEETGIDRKKTRKNSFNNR